MLLPVTQWFWKHEFWLPPGLTWEDMKETDEIRYPQPHHLLLSIPFAFLLVGLRLAFERFIAVPLSRKMGLREKVRRKPPPNAVLEAFYSRHQKGPKEKELSGLAKQCDLTPRQVERWFRSRLHQDRPSLTKKFCESCWKSLFYIISFTTSLVVLHDKPWLWDSRECWTGYPQQPLLPSLFAYYMLQLSFYTSLVITLPFDVKRKDFKEQILHHAATIFLISFSYCANYLRIGTLVMIIHDASDWLLEPTKMFNYVKWRRLCDTLFIIFSVDFLITRLVIFPNKVLYNTYYYSMELFQPFFGYYLMNILLIVLQLLHIFWSYFIIQMVYRFVKAGTMAKDLRSDSELSEKGEEEMAQEKEAKKNGPVPLSRISKEIPLQLNDSSHPSNGTTKIRHHLEGLFGLVSGQPWPAGHPFPNCPAPPDVCCSFCGPACHLLSQLGGDGHLPPRGASPPHPHLGWALLCRQVLLLGDLASLQYLPRLWLWTVLLPQPLPDSLQPLLPLRNGLWFPFHACPIGLHPPHSCADARRDCPKGVKDSSASHKQDVLIYFLFPTLTFQSSFLVSPNSIVIVQWNFCVQKPSPSD